MLRRYAHTGHCRMVACYQSWDKFDHDDAIKLIDELSAPKPGLSHTWFQLRIIEQQSGKLTGNCGLHCLGDDTQLMELGITLAPEAHFIEHVKFKGNWGSEYVFALPHREWLEQISR